MLPIIWGPSPASRPAAVMLHADKLLEAVRRRVANHVRSVSYLEACCRQAACNTGLSQ